MNKSLSSEALELLKELVSIPTVNDPSKGLKPSKEAAEYILEWLQKNEVDAEIVESNGYYSVYGVLGEKPKVMLMAHYDVVPVVYERWKYDPFKLKVVDDKAYGRGTLDDKSNVVAIMLNLKELVKECKASGIIFALTGDEEIGGENGAGIIASKLEQEGLTPKYLINADGNGMQVIIRRRKAFNVKISAESKIASVRGIVKRVKLTSYYSVFQHAHAAYFIPGVDTHPLLAASTLVRESGSLVKSIRGSFVKTNVIPPEVEVEYLTLNTGGEATEVDFALTEIVKALIPLSRIHVQTRAYSDYGVTSTPNMYFYKDKHHTVIFDVRAMSLKEDIEEAFKSAVNKLIPEAKVSVTTDSGKFMNTSQDSSIVKALVETLREIGYEAKLTESAGASDSRYFITKGTETVDFGPRGGNLHGDNEYVLIEDLVKLPQIFYKVTKKLLSSYP